LPLVRAHAQNRRCNESATLTGSFRWSRPGHALFISTNDDGQRSPSAFGDFGPATLQSLGCYCWCSDRQCRSRMERPITAGLKLPAVALAGEGLQHSISARIIPHRTWASPPSWKPFQNCFFATENAEGTVRTGLRRVDGAEPNAEFADSTDSSVANPFRPHEGTQERVLKQLLSATHRSTPHPVQGGALAPRLASSGPHENRRSSGGASRSRRLSASSGYRS
jgi:hypothetical protein